MEDERYVIKDAGIYTNIMIRKADLTGRANVEPEAAEHFPLGSMQKKQVLLELMQLQIPEVQEVIAHPENVKNIAAALGYPELYMPGQDQRYKQLVEIADLQKVDDTITEDLMPTVLPEDGIDDDETHLEICKVYLASERGQNLKKINPMAYVNIFRHMQLHLMKIQEMQVQQMMQQSLQEDKSPVEEKR